MNMFQRAAAWMVKASKAEPVILQRFANRPSWTRRNYRLFAEDGYIKNIIAYRCINEVAGGVASTEWQLKKRAKDGDDEVVHDHPLIRLLHRPNPMTGFAPFAYRWIGFYLISGNSYMEAVEARGVPQELYIQRSDRMRIETNPAGTWAQYEYKVAGKKVVWEIDPITKQSDILHWKTFHPTNDFYGLSPIEAAAYDIDIHNSALGWNKALLDNSARPSGALRYKPDGTLGARLHPDEVEQLKREIQDAYSSPRNAGRPLFLQGGLDWIEMGFSPKDMEWLESKNTTARDICYAFGVPPFVLGIPGDNTYSNQQEARLALWEQTILTLLDEGLDELNYWLVPRFGDDSLYLCVNKDKISALGPRREKVWDRVSKADWLTVNEKRSLTGFDLRDEPEADMLPVSLEMHSQDDDFGLEDDGTPKSERLRSTAEFLELDAKEFEQWLVNEGYDSVTAKAYRELAFPKRTRKLRVIEGGD